jgi:dipeptidyl aminopeptidase/acylaminoacyl peptidase
MDRRHTAIVRSRRTVRVVVAALAAAATLACTPYPGLGSVTYTRGSATHVRDLSTCRERVVPTPRPSRAVVSADGRFRAIVRVTGSGKTLHNAIVVNGRPVYSVNVSGDTSGLDSPGPIVLLGWSGDDRWIFFAVDPGSSASIAADGLILRVVSRRGGNPHRIATMLACRDYRTWCGGRLVLSGGGDRIATNNKRLLVTSPPDWRARPLVQASGRAWGSLACAPDNRSVVVQSQPESGDANFFATRWALWRVGPDGTRTRLTSPPAGEADESPRFSPDGRTLYFVRSRQGRGHRDWSYSVRRG